jgi:hypothetical protein
MKDLNGESPLAPLIEGGNKNEIQVPLIASSLKTRGILGGFLFNFINFCGRIKYIS